jgi:CheY-like chemotaxis protein
MKILIIDDNNDVLRLLEVLMNSTGQDVDIADNGIQGLEMILNNKYDLILLDITMPEFSGFSVVDKLAADNKLVKNKILFFTAASVTDLELEKWYKLGVKGCLRKPVEPDTLFEKMNEVRHTP